MHTQEFRRRCSQYLWVGKLAALLALAGCSGRTVEVAPLPPPEVTVSKPVQRSVQDSVQFTGRTEAVESVDIRARVAGYLLGVHFTEGQIIHEGDLLFQIDPRPFEATVAAANAEVARWQATHQKNAVDVVRNQKLRKTGSIAQEELDMATAQEAVAKASLEGAEADVRRAQLDLEFTKITAPIDGRIGRTFVTKGNYVSVGEANPQPLATIVSTQPMYVYFDIDERTLLRAQRRRQEKEAPVKPSHIKELKLPVLIALADESGFPHDGVLDFVDNRVDPNTGTLRARARFENEDQFLTPGLFVRVSVPMGDRQPQLLVPERSIGTDQGEKFVMVANNENVVEYRRVSLGLRTEDGLRVINGELTADDRVIVNGMQRARPGMTVRPNEAAFEAAAKPGEVPQQSADATTARADAEQDNKP